MPPTLPQVPVDDFSRVKSWIQERLVHARGEAHGALRKALVILDRDLLPRLNNGAFVVGLVGPNNAGKSALFNGLLERTCSPSRAYGGATRRLLAASGSSASTMRGFGRVVFVEPDSGGVEAACQPGPEDELLAVLAPGLPEGLWLVDAPDFDSILRTHKCTAESLMQITDLAIVVVTRHSYQNLEVVQFLGEWLSSGRPWALVYNEAPSAEVVREHCDVLARGVGASPLAVFQALLDLAVAEGIRPLQALAVGGQADPGQPLRDWIWELASKDELQRAAHAASRSALVQTLERYSDLWVADQTLRRKLHREALEVAQDFAQQVCLDAMPMGPVLQAFRTVLDRRPGMVRSQLRKGLQQARKGLTYVWTKVGGSLTAAESSAPLNLQHAERDAFLPLWAPFIDRLENRLMSLGAGSHGEWRAMLERDLAPARLLMGRECVVEALQADPGVWQAFEHSCEGFIEEDLDQRGNEWSLQALVDLSHLLPAAVAGAIIVKSGGLLTDMAVGSMGAVSSMAMEKLSKFLGTGIANRARTRWAQLRGPKLTENFLRHALVETWPLLQETESGDARDWARWLNSNRGDLDHA